MLLQRIWYNSLSSARSTMRSENLTPPGIEKDSLPDWQKILQSGKPLDPQILLDRLTCQRRGCFVEPNGSLLPNSAKDHLLDGWIDHLNDFIHRSGYHPNNNLETFENLQNRNRGKLHGVIFIPQCKSYTYTTQIIDQVVSWYDESTALLLPDHELPPGEDAAVSIPLIVRISLLSYTNPGLTISVKPERPENIHSEIHHKEIAHKIGAFIHPIKY